MLKIEYRFVQYEKSLTSKSKNDILHKEAYLLLDKMLRDIEIFEYEIKKTSLGKPYIEGFPVHFSIAHTDGLVCCIISDKECGIDCEKIEIKENVQRMAERYFVGDEITKMKESDFSFEEFLRIWTCKEAIGKRLGCGVMKAIKIDSTKENCSTIIENGYVVSVNI